MNIEPGSAAELTELAAQLATPVRDDNGASLAIRGEAGTRLLPLERFRRLPSSMHRHVDFRYLAEFVAYVMSHRSNSGSYGLAQFRPLRVQYVIDYGTHLSPQWGTHRAHFSPALSPAYSAWFGKQGKPMTHAEFAAFIEERAPDCYHPDSATMLELALSFQAGGEMSFSSAVRLESGDVQLQYANQVRGTSRAGHLEIPATFAIRIPVYEFHELIELTARLRYRVKDGALSIWYQFANLEDTLALHDTALLNKIRASVPEIALGSIMRSLEPLTSGERE